jgi:23S rRNA pseudouridine955/2504/2580 synthase
MRGSRGPRQPGGGKQAAGPRHRQRFSGHADAGAKRPPKGDDPDSSPGRPARFSPAQAGEVDERRSPGGRRHGRAFFKRADRPPKDDDRKQRRLSTPSPAPVVADGTAGREKPTTVQNVAVTADEAGMRVDRFLEARFPGLSFSHIQRVIRKGEVRVNGKRTQPKNRLEAGQTVRIPPLRLDQPKPRAPGNEADEKTRAFLKSITLYEDADVLVLNKPIGLAVQGGSGTTRHIDGMLEVLRDAHGQRPRLVHRIDKDTAGCLLVAKTRFAAAALAKTFRSRSARKIYWALAAGVPKVQQGRISTYLVKEEREEESLMRIARHGDKGASHAVTYYAVVETSGPLLSWLSLKPVTGRTHQLRAHMAHINHPIVGDPKYFSRENWELPGGMQNKLHLLARRIVVPHPRGGVIDSTAPLPPHMQQSWNLLGLDAARYDPIVEAPEE